MVSRIVKYKRNSCLFFGSIFVCLLILQQFFYYSSQSELERELVNSFHTPWFFLLTSLIWVFQRTLIKKYDLVESISFMQSLLICMVLSMLLAVLTEVLQIFNSRQASFIDVVRDMLGAGCALCLIVAGSFKQSRRFAAMGVLLIGATGLFLSGFISVGRELIILKERNDLVPTLVSFDLESGSSGARINSRSDLSMVIASSNWPEIAGLTVAKMVLDSGRWPGFSLEEVYPDWSKYSVVSVRLYLDGEGMLPMTVRASTSTNWRGEEVELTLSPGDNHFELPILTLIPDIESGSAKVKSLLFYSDRAYSGRVIYIGNIHLE